jgi:thioesterase domain-containing protein
LDVVEVPSLHADMMTPAAVTHIAPVLLQRLAAAEA